MSLLENLRGEVARYQGRPFLEAAMAVCALTANADGYVSLSERYRVDALIVAMDELNLFDPREAIEILDANLAALHDAYDETEVELMEKIARYDDDLDRSRALLKIARLIIVADGEISDSERAMLADICAILSVNPADIEFGDGFSDA